MYKKLSLLSYYKKKYFLYVKMVVLIYPYKVLLVDSNLEKTVIYYFEE